MSTTIRVSESTRQRVADLATKTGSQMQVVVERAIAAYERALFWEGFVDGYRRLAEDAEGWEQVQAERSDEAPALRDGLE